MNFELIYASHETSPKSIVHPSRNPSLFNEGGAGISCLKSDDGNDVVRRWSFRIKRPTPATSSGF
jgi:hypothetical protein